MRRFPPFSKLHVILLIILLHLNSGKSTLSTLIILIGRSHSFELDGVNSMINHQATRIGSIKIDFDSSTTFGKSWPEGIKFVKRYEAHFRTTQFEFHMNSSALLPSRSSNLFSTHLITRTSLPPPTPTLLLSRQARVLRRKRLFHGTEVIY